MTLPDVLRQVRRLEIRSRRLVQDVLAGEYASVFKGRGVEFADVRPYVPGDDVRTIDWRVTARAGAPFVRRYTEERELTLLFVVDHSASDDTGTRARTKVELATEVCAVLALAAVRNNDRVGAVLFTDRVEHFVPPAKGKRHALRVLRRRAVVFVLSDWLAPDFTRALEMVARRHDTIGVHLADPRDAALPDVGLVALRDPESGAWRYVNCSDSAQREALRRAAAARDRELVRLLRANRADVIRLRTGDDYVAPLLGFFRRRERMRRH